MLFAGGARADDNLKIAIGQRGGWEQSVSELGQNKGIFKKHGLTLELLYTQGSAETLQSVISNSVDIGIGLGTHALLGAFLKGAPLRGVGASFTSADEQYYYVVADSPVKSMKDADGKIDRDLDQRLGLQHVRAAPGAALRRQPEAATGRQLHRDLDAGADQAARHRLLGGAVQSQFRRRGQNPHHRPRQRRAGAARHDEPASGRQRAGLERRKDVLKRYMAAYRETLDWMYADPAAIDAYAEWSKLPKAIAAQAPEYMTRQNMEPLRISGLPGIMEDAVKFKYIPAPLSDAQIKEALPVDALK